MRRKMKTEKEKPTENTIGKVGRPAGLTERQKTFAKYYVEGDTVTLNAREWLATLTSLLSLWHPSF